jgi:hypothetical protein
MDNLRATHGSFNRMPAWGWAILALANTGCTVWTRDHADLGRPPAPARHFQIWVHGRAQIINHVQTRADTLFGEPVPHICDTCRVSYLVSTIDSVRVTHFSTGRTVALVLVPVTLTTVVLLLVSHLSISLH